MLADTERREAARRLREVQADVIPGTKTEVHPIAGRIVGVACGYDLPDFQGLLGRLADLIDPDCEEGRYEGVHTARPVDRDALLALADEMERRAPYALHGGWRDSLRDYARRIREALGVES